MRPIPTLKPRYITDADGRKKGIILSIEEYEELMEDIDDLAVLAERREQPTIWHEELVAERKRNGYLPDRVEGGSAPRAQEHRPTTRAAGRGSGGVTVEGPVSSRELSTLTAYAPLCNPWYSFFSEELAAGNPPTTPPGWQQGVIPVPVQRNPDRRA